MLNCVSVVARGEGLTSRQPLSDLGNFLIVLCEY